MPLRVVLMGTPDFAVPAFQAIVDAGHQVVAVYTRAPQPKGRGQMVQKSAVHEWADRYGLPVLTPARFKKSPEACAEFARLKPEVAVVAAYGLILPQDVLDTPRFGCLNIHASLLPRWRGASPIQRAIWAGDTQTGVTIMQMEAGLDTGGMIVSSSIPIGRMDTAELHDHLANMGSQLIIDVLGTLARDGVLQSVPQPDVGVTYAPMLKKEEGQIDWAQAATQIDAQIRALTPWPGTVTTLPDGQVIKIFRAECNASASWHPWTPACAGDTLEEEGRLMNPEGDVQCGAGTTLRIVRVQAPSGKKMDIAALINGGYIKIGQRLGAAECARVGN